MEPGDRPTPTPEIDALAACLHGTWVLDEAVFSAMLYPVLVDYATEAGVATTDTTITGTQTVTFDTDGTFTATTMVSGSVAAETVRLSLEAWTTGTWRTDGQKVAAPTVDYGGTATQVLHGESQSDDLAGADDADFAMLPRNLAPASCTDNTLTFTGVGRVLDLPDVPDDLVFTRRS